MQESPFPLLRASRVVLSICVASLILLLATSGTPSGAQESAGWPRRLTYAAGIVPRGLNPMLDRAGWNEVSSVVLGRLLRPDHAGGLAGDLARSWSVSPDGRTYTFDLHPDAVWHDGQPFTSADVIFTWDRLFDPKTESSLDLNQASLLRWRASGPHRVVFELKAPDTGFLAAVTEIPILPAHLLRNAELNSDYFDRHFVGTGPYRLLRREGSAYLFARHEKYHFGVPAFPELVIRIIAGDEERARAIATGSADLGHVKPPHLALLREHGRRIVRFRTGAWRGMPLNLRRPALQDVRVRRAIDLAIDRETIARRILQGFGEPAYSPIPPASWAFTPAMNVRRFDPARAAQLLDEAGWRMNPSTQLRERDGHPLELHLIIWKDEEFRRATGEWLEESLKPLGIRVVLHRVDGPTYNRLAESMADDYDGYIGGWGGLLDPGDNLYKKYHSRGSQNRNGYAHPQVDAWLEEARRSTDRSRAIALYENVVRQITADAVFLPLAYPDYLFALRPELDGIHESTLDSWYEFTKYAGEWKPRKE